MTTIMPKTVFDKKVDNIQHQLDIMRRESETFRAHANSHFEFVHTEVATKDDLYKMEARLKGEMATKEDVHTLRAGMATKEDVHTLRAGMATKKGIYMVEGNLVSLTALVQKIAEKVGVST